MTAAAAVTVAADTRPAGAETTTLPDEWVPRPEEQSWWQTRQSREALVERLLHAFTDPSAGRTRDKTRRRRGPAPGNTTQCQTKRVTCSAQTRQPATTCRDFAATAGRR